MVYNKWSIMMLKQNNRKHSVHSNIQRWPNTRNATWKISLWCEHICIRGLYTIWIKVGDTCPSHPYMVLPLTFATKLEAFSHTELVLYAVALQCPSTGT